MPLSLRYFWRALLLCIIHYLPLSSTVRKSVRSWRVKSDLFQAWHLCNMRGNYVDVLSRHVVVVCFMRTYPSIGLTRQASMGAARNNGAPSRPQTRFYYDILPNETSVSSPNDAYSICDPKMLSFRSLCTFI